MTYLVAEDSEDSSTSHRDNPAKIEPIGDDGISMMFFCEED